MTNKIKVYVWLIFPTLPTLEKTHTLFTIVLLAHFFCGFMKSNLLVSIACSAVQPTTALKCDNITTTREPSPTPLSREAEQRQQKVEILLRLNFHPALSPLCCCCWWNLINSLRRGCVVYPSTATWAFSEVVKLEKERAVKGLEILLRRVTMNFIESDKFFIVFHPDLVT